jgi:hypothetical protein
MICLSVGNGGEFSLPAARERAAGSFFVVKPFTSKAFKKPFMKLENFS